MCVQGRLKKFGFVHSFLFVEYLVHLNHVSAASPFFQRIYSQLFQSGKTYQLLSSACLLFAVVTLVLVTLSNNYKPAILFIILNSVPNSTSAFLIMQWLRFRQNGTVTNRLIPPIERSVLKYDISRTKFSKCWWLSE